MADIRVRCPWCLFRTGSLGKRPFGRHVSVNLETGKFLCWRCGRGRGEILTKAIANELGIGDLYIPRSKRAYVVPQPKLPPVEDLPDGYVPLFPYREVRKSLVLRPYLLYLKDRGVRLRSLRSFGVGVVIAPKEKKWRDGFIVFPLRDTKFRGYILHKTPYARFKKCSAYVNSPGLQREEGAFLGGVLLESDRTKIYVVEGPMDYIQMQHNAVASLGIDMTEQQISRLASFPGTVVVCGDGDAWKASMCIARRIRIRGGRSRWVKMPPGTDPGMLKWDRVGTLPTLE